MALITLTGEEVKVALAKALSEKTQHVLGEFDPDDCYMTVFVAGKEVDDVDEITFTGSA